MKRICKQCGKEFVLTDAEEDFYKKKNLTLPKRCKACREKSKRQDDAHHLVGKGFMKAAAGIMLLLVMLFMMKQNGMFSKEKDQPQTMAGIQTEAPEEPLYTFRSEKFLLSHYEKHGIEMGFDSAQAYEAAANQVIQNPDVLHKLEAEDGDDVYYLEATNEFVVVSADGYIRTYFNPDSGMDYFNRQ